MPVESLILTQVKQIHSISNTYRMVKVLLQAAVLCTDGNKKNEYGMSKGSNAVTSSTTLVGIQS